MGVGVGPAVRLDDWPTQFRFEFDVGYYFENRPEGFFLAFSPAASFAENFYVFTFPLRLGYMFTIYRGRDVSFQLGPTGTLGLAVTGLIDPSTDPVAWFHFSLAFGARVLLADDTVAIYLRPLDFEFAFTDGADAIRYLLVGGVQVHL